VEIDLLGGKNHGREGFSEEKVYKKEVKGGGAGGR